MAERRLAPEDRGHRVELGVKLTCVPVANRLLRALNSRAGESALTRGALSILRTGSASPVPHAYVCKPGSRYVMPRKVKITIPKPRMAKYAALRPRHPRVMRICK